MAATYARSDIISGVKQHFAAEGFTCDEYPARFPEIRMPLYCRKEDGTIVEEVVVDIITDVVVSKERFMRPIQVDGAVVEDACPPKFFQHYLPHAKVFWAYGSKVAKDAGYDHLQRACEAAGVGLIEVANGRASIVLPARSVAHHFRERIQEAAQLHGPSAHELVDKVCDLAENARQEYLHYLIYYGDPEFRRQALISRETQYLSLVLVDRLEGITKLEYKDVLIQLAREYRNATKSDYDLALDAVKSLWKPRLGVDYPDFQKEFEAILLLNPSYREHFLHAFQVFLLGALIIDRIRDTDAVEGFARQTGSSLEDAWLAASTYHDFNYPIQDFEKWMKSFFEKNLNLNIRSSQAIGLNLEKMVIRDEFLSKMRSLCSAIGYQLDDSMMRFVFERAVVNRNHAVLGALSFLKTFQHSTRLSTAAMNQAALGILLHHEDNWQLLSGKKTKKLEEDWERELCGKRVLEVLTLESLPLAFLLVFCDVVQEWGRVGRDFESTKAQLEDMEIGEDRIWFHISMLDDASLEWKQKEVTRLKGYLRDPRFGIKIESRRGASSAECWMTGT